MPTATDLVVSVMYTASKLQGLSEEQLAPFWDDLKQIDEDLDGITDELGV